MTKDLRRFYVYAYLRSKDSARGPKYSPYYIGKGQERRAFNQHKRIIRANDRSYIAFVQEGLTEADAFLLETYCIQMYGRIDLGTGILHNRTNGGEGTSGVVISEGQRQERSERVRKEKHPLWGKKRPEEHRRRMSEAHMGMKLSEETKQKLSKANKGSNNSQWGKRGNLSPCWGKQHSEETRNKISNARRKYLYELIDANNKIYTTNNLTIFGKQHDLNASHLFSVVTGKRKHHKGWTGRIIQRLQ